MTTPTKGVGERDRGAAMVELALILPILVMLLVGIIEFGRAYNQQVQIQGAAREGARALALGSDASAAVCSALDPDTCSEVSVSQSGCPANADPTSTAYATVTVTVDFEFGIPFVTLGSKTLAATAAMRCGL